jgi:hypothetical protein
LSARQFVELRANGGRQRRGIRVHLADDFRNDPLALFDKREQQMLRQNLRVAFAIGQLLRGQDRFLGFLGVLIDIHCSVTQ